MAVNPPKHIAVIGAGISGITAAYLLQKKHRVTLFERNDYIGGHTNTVTIPSGPDAGTPVDTGFIVLNYNTYLNTCIFRRRFWKNSGHQNGWSIDFSQDHAKTPAEILVEDLCHQIVESHSYMAIGYFQREILQHPKEFFIITCIFLRRKPQSLNP